ncbi:MULTISPECIES: hypothetical protein [Nocardia]|uniref:hypothetical protein n=1 Tax=Nocardia TaxID=1817 RepID=UPI0007EB3F8A|nr:MULTISPECIES: hypothetical protein [Nocardia]MBF6275996.1 hypothetical protein [Nocardia nova]OBA55890.1 hypothetical protein A5789_00670 [Nocardia sp. 852002-51101_SCH5132738]OBB53586.1 hypothetical protein A5748_13760 [Nocardia sp. 852002-51244_SCH5132740]OBF77349.1 hypothetical protein A9X06_23970 [Mycobacterium sp. 852002-51759_SCH5129042]
MPASTLTDRRCEDCSHPIDDNTTVTTVEGDHLCRACADRLDTCDDCATPTRKRRSTVRGTDVCTECSIGWRRCRDCDRFDSDLVRVIGHGEVCDDCADSYLVCDDCGSRADGLNETEAGADVCGRCEDADYHRCGGCDILIRCWEDYCDTCANERPDHHGVHSYSYKPEPDFHGTGPLYLGLELEIKTPRDVFEEAVELAIDRLGDIGYLKEDGSIQPCGFELVTHPVSYEFARQQFPWSLLNRLRLLGAYTDTSVGIHVHVSRAGFSSPAHTYRWLKFVYRNESHIKVLARRDSEQWAVFDPSARANAAAHAKGDTGGAFRYRAINVCPEDTFELRVFASSLHTREVQAALAFANASVEYTRTLSAADIARRRGWEWAAFTAWLAARPEYRCLTDELEALACAS